MTAWGRVQRALDACRQAIARISARAILAIGFAGLIVYAFPGYMSPDSDDQLLEARAHEFSDAHPPIMAAEWAVLDAVVSGPALMLVVQGGLFLLGIAALLGRVLTPRRAALAAVLVLWFPPVFTPMAVIWKDSQMAAYLFAGIAAVLSPRRAIRLAGLGLLTLGCAFRHNGFAASVPLVGLLFEWRVGLRWWQRYAMSAVAAIASFALAIGITHVLTTKPHQSIWENVALADISAVLRSADDRSDDDLREALRGTPLVTTTNIQATLRTGAGVFGPPDPARDHDAIMRAWTDIVVGDPGAYVRNRLVGFEATLGLTDAPMWGPVWHQFVGETYDEVRIHHDTTLSWIQTRLVKRFVRYAYHTSLFRPYVYALLALLLLVACCRDRLTFALLVSGLVYELSLFPAAGAADFRYSHWMIATTCVATVLLFVQRLRGRGPAQAVVT